jgi:hypothetical protein
MVKKKRSQNVRGMRKLTIAEKEIRGTRQRAYDPKVRGLADIQADVESAQNTLESLQLTTNECGKAIRKLGVVIPSGRGATSTHKPNPAIRIQAWALTAIRGLKRELIFLCEEAELALEAEKPVDDDFAGL